MIRHIDTSQGRLTDPEFEAAARSFFRDPDLRELPASAQVDRFLTRYEVPAAHHDWARAVSQRALIKVLLASP